MAKKTADKKRRRSWLRRTAVVGTVVLVLAVGATGAVTAQTAVDDCAYITQSGSYDITQDLEGVISFQEPFCLGIESDDIVIDGNGHRVNSTSPLGFSGIAVDQFGLTSTSPKNVTIKNVTVTNYDKGVDVLNAEDVNITSVGVANATTAISAENVTGLTVDGATLSQTDKGVGVNDSVDVTVRDSFVTSDVIIDFPIDPIDPPIDQPDLLTETQVHESDGTGIFFNNTIDGRIVDNTVTRFDGPGIEVLSSGPSFDLTPGPIVPPPPVLPSGEVSPAQSSNEISGNEVTDNSEGILFEDSSGYEIADNTASGNTAADFRVVDADSSGTSVANLQIGESTEPETTLSFVAKDVSLGAVDNPSDDPAALENIGRYFDAQSLSDSPFLNVSVGYEDDDADTVNESTLELQRDVGTQWVPVPGSSVDTTNNVVSANITTFSDFGVFGEADGGSGSENPFFDSNDDPIDRQTVISRIVEWNLNGSIDGTSYTRQEIIGFLVQWNLETSGGN